MAIVKKKKKVYSTHTLNMYRTTRIVYKFGVEGRRGRGHRRRGWREGVKVVANARGLDMK